MDDERIQIIHVDEIETSFAADRTHGDIQIWVKDEAGASYALHFRKETARQLSELLETLDRKSVV